MDIDAGYSMLRAYPSREILGLNWAKGHGVRQLGGLFLRFWTAYTCTYDISRLFRVTEGHDRIYRNYFGFLQALTEVTTELLGFGQFGLGLGFYGSVLRSSVYMPTHNVWLPQYDDYLIV